MNDAEARLYADLAALGIDYEVYEHAAVFTVEDSSQHTRHINGAHTKNLFLKDKAGVFWLVTVPDDARVDLKALPDAVGCGRVSFGNAEDMQKLLGISPGSVTALAAINDIGRAVCLVLDERLAKADIINCHPLRNSATLSLAPNDLIRALTHWRHIPIVAPIPTLGACMTLETISTNTAFGGAQGVYKHSSTATGTDMTFSVYVPLREPGAKLPVVWYLSGLTCTHANVTDKGEYRRACAELGLIFVAPDTSPRGEGVPDDPDGAYDFGLGAGFYVDVLVDPYAAHYRMRTYVESELPKLVAEHFPVDTERQAIMGHSMGGHGALTVSLRNPGHYRSTSAFAPIVSPMNCPWGEKALNGYLGSDRTLWEEYDACTLIRNGARLPDLLVDQGDADNFLTEQLKTHLLVEACEVAGQKATVRMQPGYDHSYYFISTFMAEHLAWHAERLKA